jgi:hypothetical protein
MINFLKRNVQSAVIVFLAIALLSVGLFSIGMMHHDGSMMEEFHASISCKSTDCGAPTDGVSCLDHCINAAQNLTQTIPVNLGIKLSLLLALGLFLGFLFSLILDLSNDHRFSKSRLQQLYDESKAAFFHQIGFWLTLFEKRDPSYSFALA